MNKTCRLVCKYFSNRFDKNQHGAIILVIFNKQICQQIKIKCHIDKTTKHLLNSGTTNLNMHRFTIIAQDK